MYCLRSNKNVRSKSFEFQNEQPDYALTLYICTYQRRYVHTEQSKRGGLKQANITSVLKNGGPELSFMRG